MRAKNPLIVILTALFTTVAAGAQESNAPGHLRLVDKLDRPEDGYCLDVVGFEQLSEYLLKPDHLP